MCADNTEVPLEQVETGMWGKKDQTGVTHWSVMWKTKPNTHTHVHTPPPGGPLYQRQSGQNLLQSEHVRTHTHTPVALVSLLNMYSSVLCV